MSSKEKFRLTSMIFGILSLVTMFFGLGLPFAAVGLIMALLSKDAEPMQGYAVAGFITSLIGLIISLLITVSAFYAVFSGAFDHLFDNIFEGFEDLYDETYDEYDDLFNDYFDGYDGYYYDNGHHYDIEHDPYGLYSDDMIAYAASDCVFYI